MVTACTAPCEHCHHLERVALASRALQLAIADAIDEVCQAPEVGELQVSDLAGIQVYKFRFNRQEYLMAYRMTQVDQPMAVLPIDFYQVDSQENFYTALKQYINSQDAS